MGDWTNLIRRVKKPSLSVSAVERGAVPAKIKGALPR